MVSVLDSTQDLLCRKLTNHFVSLCLNVETVSKSSSRKEKEDAEADDEDADDEEPTASEEGGDRSWK